MKWKLDSIGLHRDWVLYKPEYSPIQYVLLNMKTILLLDLRHTCTILLGIAGAMSAAHIILMAAARPSATPR